MNLLLRGTPSGRIARLGVLGALFLAIATAFGAHQPLADEAVFATPEKAVEAFAAAVKSPNGRGLLDLFGAEHEADLLGGDPAAARQGVQQLRAAVDEAVTLSDDGADRKTLVLGRRAWPMPIPLVETADGWAFDVDAGIDEINDRRIGRNELSAIDFCRSYLAAQVEYASADRDGDQVLEYAQKLESTPSQRDGLYWRATSPDDVSPLGPFAAEAEQYLEMRRSGEPYRGYHFRVLKAQGTNVPGGAYDYVINENMIAGYALIGWPADYGRSGIMTFLCSHHGTIYETDLGPETEGETATTIAFDPDGTWSEVTE